VETQFQASPIYSIVLFLYFAVVIGIGIYFSKRVGSDEDYYLAGRGLNAPVTGFSYSVTQMSAGTLIGMIGVLGTIGYNYLPVCIASAAGPWVTFIMIGERIRRISEKLGAVTYGEIFERRFGPSVKLLYGIAVIVFIIPLITGQIQASGNILQVVLGVPYVYGMIITTAIIVIYVTLSGMFGVAWSDFIQGVIMCVGVLIMTPAVVSSAGGFSQGLVSLKAIDPRLIKLTGFVTGTWVFCNVLTWSLFQIGANPHSMFRFLIPKNVRTLRRAMLWALACTVIIFFSLSFVGPFSRVLLPDLEKRDLTMPILATRVLPPFIGSLLLSAVIAAIMSTVDSILLLVSSAATRDVYPVLSKSKVDPKKQLALSRYVTIIVSALGFLGAVRPLDLVQWLVALAFQLLASTLFVPIILTCWWPRFNKTGALAGMLGGATTAIVWFIVGWVQYGSLSQWPGGWWPAVLGVAVSAVFAIAGTLLTEPPPEKVVQEFYS